MMKTYDLYRVTADSLQDARRLVEQALGFEFVPHESRYHCGDYYRQGGVGQEHFTLQRNYDNLESEWTEPQHTDSPFLLYVNETDRSSEIQRALEEVADVSLLRQQFLDE